MNKIINKIIMVAVVTQIVMSTVSVVSAQSYDDLNGTSFNNSTAVDSGVGYSYVNYDPNTPVSYSDLNNTNFGGASTYYGTQSCTGCNVGSTYSQPTSGSGYSYVNYDPNTPVSYSDLNNTNFGGASTYYGTQSCTGCNTGSSYVTPTYGNSGSSYVSPTYTSPTYSSGYVAPSYGYSNAGYSNVGYSNVGYSNTGYSNTGYTSGTVVNTFTCPSGTTQNGTTCVNNITGTVVTNINCPTGTTLTNGQCINNVTGTVVTNINCPSGTVLTNGQCVNNVTGTVVTNVNCPTGTTLTNGQCINTVTPPVTTVTNCPSNTTYVNGICQQIVNPPVVTYQTCWNGSVIPNNSVCPAQYKVCPNGTSVPINQPCYVTTTPIYIAPQVVKFNNVVTSPVTQITNVSGRCNGIGLIANNAPSTGWFEYGETPNLGRTTNSANIGQADTAPFSNVLANLKPHTQYYCRAVMQNQYGLVKGEIVGFVTKTKITTYVRPVIVTHVTTKPPVKKTIACSDGTTVAVKNQSSATLINQGQKLLTLSIEKVEGNLVSEGTVRYKVSYKNLADTKLSGVIVKVTLPQEIRLMSASAGNYDETSRTLTLNQDTIDPYTEGSILLVGTVLKDSPIGKSIVTNVYAAYTVPGTRTQDEVTAYVVGSILPVANITNVDTGAKHVIGAGTTKSFMPNSLIEWLALLAILFIIFILARSVYASYKDNNNHRH